MSVYELPPNFPSYQNVKIGDIFIWYVGDSTKTDKRTGEKAIHGHWFKVVYKDPSYAMVDVEFLRCDNPCKAECSHTELFKQTTIGWSKLQEWKDKSRWLTTPGARVLFSERGTK